MSAAIHYLSQRKRMKIGIYGGSFDPVTSGHLITAQVIAEDLKLDRVIFEPVSDAYEYKGKKPKVSAPYRVCMLMLALQKSNKVFKTGRIDAQSLKMNTSYELMNLYLEKDKENNESNEYYFICGSDVLSSMPTWENGELLLNTFKVAVLERNTHKVDDTMLQGILLEQYMRHNIIVVRPPLYMDISSTAVRQRVCEGKSIRYFVPECVAQYIHKNNLYKHSR